jgi:GT2 family glycosyltransferase
MADSRPRANPTQPAADIPPSSTVCEIETFSGPTLQGWAIDRAAPNASPVLHFIVDGQEIARCECSIERTDIVTRSGGFAKLGFHVTLPDVLADGQQHRLHIRDWHRREVPMVLQGQRYQQIDFKWEWTPTVRSYIDGLRYGAFEGWVMRSERGVDGLLGDCMLRVACDGMTIGHVRANQHRGDVARAASGPSNCGFRFDPPASVRSGHPRRFQFFLMPENIELEGSPCVTSLVDDDAQRRLLELVASVDEMHRELTRIRRQLHEIAPKPRYSVADYDRWFRLYEPALRRRVAAARPADGWADGPLVSILCPVYRPGLSDFRAAIASVQAQTYPSIELILVDDCSKDKGLDAFIASLVASDSRIRLVKHRKNQGISAATNTALKAARGAYVAFFDHDDALVDVAIECMVAAALTTGADMLYSDEDKIDDSGRYSVPAFKPDWNHRLMLGVNYVCHLLFVRRALTVQAGPLDSRYDGAQDHEYILRLSEHIAADRIHHVPEVLYHWRITAGSTAATVSNKTYAIDAGVRAVSDHLARIGRPATVETMLGQTLYRQTWVLDHEPPISIIIPYKDEIGITERCLDAILSTTRYTNYDVILVDNWSTSAEAAAFAKRVGRMERVRVLRIEEEFNYSRLNNLAAASTQAEFLVFLNNDVFVGTADWLSAIVSEAVSDPAVGAVGGKFTYPDGSIQHAGVVTGIGGVAGHVHVGLMKDDNGYGGRLLFAQEMSAVTAAGVLVRAAAFQRVGGFDETHLRVAFNDIDLCLKLRQAGFKIIWTPDFVAEHHESLSRGNDERPMQETRFFDEIEVMKARWGGLLARDPFYHPNFALDRQSFFDLVDPDQAGGSVVPRDA